MECLGNIIAGQRFFQGAFPRNGSLRMVMLVEGSQKSSDKLFSEGEISMYAKKLSGEFVKVC